MIENRQLADFKGKCCRFRNSSECLKIHCGTNNWSIWTQKVPTEAKRCGLQTSGRVFFQKYSVVLVHEQSAVENSFSMLYPGRFVLVESVGSHAQSLSGSKSPRLQDSKAPRSQASRIPGSQTLRLPSCQNFPAPRISGSKVTRLPGSQTPRLPRFPGS